MLPGTHSDKGALFVSTVAPASTDSFIGGIAVSRLGVVRVVEAAPTRFANGYGVSNLGQLCIAPGGSKDVYAMGLPFTNDGRLVVQLNAAFGLYDSFVGGVRVGPNGGVYTIDIEPPAQFGFSNGFSNGFDIT